MALAAHMARTDGKVSLVVVPRYLEADRELVDQLRKQRKLVTGGVVLGQTRVLPEETRVLLRQLLTSTYQQNVLTRAKETLESFGILVTALGALAAFMVVAAGTAPEIQRQISKVAKRYQLGEQFKQLAERLGSFMAEGSRFGRAQTATAPTIAIAWTALKDGQEVTIWLRSEWKVTGNKNGQHRLDNATYEKREKDGSQSKQTGGSLLVPFEDVELVAFDDSQKQGSK